MYTCKYANASCLRGIATPLFITFLLEIVPAVTTQIDIIHLRMLIYPAIYYPRIAWEGVTTQQQRATKSSEQCPTRQLSSFEAAQCLAGGDGTGIVSRLALSAVADFSLTRAAPHSLSICEVSPPRVQVGVPSRHSPSYVAATFHPALFSPPWPLWRYQSQAHGLLCITRMRPSPTRSRCTVYFLKAALEAARPRKDYLAQIKLTHGTPTQMLCPPSPGVL